MCKINNSSSKAFLAIIAFTVCLSIVAFYYKSYIYKEKLQIVVELQQEDSEQLRQLLSSTKIQNTNNKYLKEDILSCIDNHSSKMQRELEMVKADIESGIDMLALWASIITIVFLVFSIYSIFKTDEMLSKAKESLDNIKVKEGTVNKICNNLETQNRSITESLSQKVATIDNQATLLSEKLATIQHQFDSVGDSETQGQQNENEEENVAGTQTEPIGQIPTPPTRPEHPDA